MLLMVWGRGMHILARSAALRQESFVQWPPCEVMLSGPPYPGFRRAWVQLPEGIERGVVMTKCFFLFISSKILRFYGKYAR